MKIMMRPTLACLLLFSVIANSAMADGRAANAQVNPAELLKHYLPESCYQTGLYKQQKSIAGINKLLETEGSFAYACDKGLLWHTAAPLQETLVYQLQGTTHLVRADGSSQKLSGAVQRQLGQMLNHLLGGNSAYLEKTFAIVASDTGIQLTPRKKRMEKFLRHIHITRSSDAVTIRLQHQGDEYTAIRVYELQPLPSLNADQCVQLLATAPVALACAQLLTP
ncbi:hypothetical protein [Cellvibrio sp. QJXJ]|uniref:hypothetical protein n=1 Tax=Cellvibrio sp. QJXJ TaxID=2964606 RepID=UPI0021C48A85|nr:hypothetical protein [Cellvibrio sp. QJXJ]UUA72048.1 hypothetical protein NNX04_16705 [Cellvibrio sp. QJXJ]